MHSKIGSTSLVFSLMILSWSHQTSSRGCFVSQKRPQKESTLLPLYFYNSYRFGASNARVLSSHQTTSVPGYRSRHFSHCIHSELMFIYQTSYWVLKCSNQTMQSHQNPKSLNVRVDPQYRYMRLLKILDLWNDWDEMRKQEMMQQEMEGVSWPFCPLLGSQYLGICPKQELEDSWLHPQGPAASGQPTRNESIVTVIRCHIHHSCKWCALRALDGLDYY